MANHPRAILKDFLWMIVLLGVIAVALRLVLGLGATSGLNDTTPWGLWIAFKLCFVALAGGGFTLAAIVYIFHLESYRPILRRAILIALLGYGSFIISLIFDLGLPWHIYMPIIRWQPHSVMFEIAWCVLLYFSVLALEFGPVILEHPRFQHPWFQVIYRLLRKSTIVLVIAGVVLSTLHQSSLGSLFLMMPHRVHPLWYSAWIPVMFFISAIAAGLLALILESHAAQKLFERGLHPELLVKIGRIASFALWLYLAVRLGDLIGRGVLPGALDGSFASLLFLAEVGLGGLLPAILLSIPKVRNTPEGLISAAILGVAGILSQRMALSLFTMQRPLGMAYTPSLLEIVIAFAIPSAALLIYLFFNEQLAILGAASPSAEEQAAPAQTAFAEQFHPLTRVAIRQDGYATIVWRSGLAVFTAAILLAVLPSGRVTGQNLAGDSARPAVGWEVLLIDGLRSGTSVSFPHAEHQQRQIDKWGSTEQACAVCHHVQIPDGKPGACASCHQDFYQPVAIFDHLGHQGVLGGNDSCQECHPGEHSSRSTVPCQECHKDLVAENGEPLSAPVLAPGYLDAMHGMCRDCHEKEALSRLKPELRECSTCHPALPVEVTTLKAQ